MTQIIRSQDSMGSALRDARRRANLTQQDLGLKTGLRQATISRLEGGGGGTLDTVFKVTSALKVDLQLAPRTTGRPNLDELF